jgi:hypothetical protein
MESEKYDTLTVNELFSKLKSAEVTGLSLKDDFCGMAHSSSSKRS